MERTSRDCVAIHRFYTGRLLITLSIICAAFLGCRPPSSLTADEMTKVVSSTPSTTTGVSPFLYVYNTGGVDVYKLDPTTGASLGKTDLTYTDVCGWLLTNSNSSFGFAGCSGDGTIHSYAINSVTGAPVSVQSLTSTYSQVGLTLDPRSRFIYALHGDDTIGWLSIDSVTGALTEHAAIAADPSCNYPVNLAVDGLGKFAYVVCYNSETVSVYSIDQSTGAPTLVGHQSNAGSDLVGPSWVGTDPSGSFVFVTNQNGSTISSYGINSVTGTLTLITGALALNADPMVYVGPDWGSVHPSGKMMFTTNQGTGEQFSAIKINANGSLTLIGDINGTWGSGSQPGMILNHNFAYVGMDTTVSVMSLDLDAGTVSYSQAFASDAGSGGTQGSSH